MRGVGVMKKDKMKYLAHIDGKREQSIKEHLEGTAVLAAYLGPGLVGIIFESA